MTVDFIALFYLGIVTIDMVIFIVDDIFKQAYDNSK